MNLAAPTLRSIVQESRAGLSRALPSWCTAHQRTLRSIFTTYRDDNDPILVEATCNQVNQEGGYTGMTSAAFRAFVGELAESAGVSPDRLILGGDHLGPNPWRRLPAREAVVKASELVRAFVETGFVKIHLDAGMSCGGEAKISDGEIAHRAAKLCAVAESAAKGREVLYVIGTEVPVPGGETEPIGSLAVTPREDVERTFDLHRREFASLGVGDAANCVIAVVVQPGVDFGADQVVAFEKNRAADLVSAVEEIPNLVYEAHSTDFQTLRSLMRLVDCHFAFLKVGPELTFAFREAAFAMAAMECGVDPLGESEVVRALEGAMDADPSSWRDYVAPGAGSRLGRLFALSDRVRYGSRRRRCDRRAIRARRLRINPYGLVSQFAGRFDPDETGLSLSEQIVQSRVGAVVARYRMASRREVSSANVPF
jgi:D-tagatose-bisphosphate aldolase class II non-catalytic subunit